MSSAHQPSAPVAARVIRTAELAPQPWANGRGRTREVYRQLAAGSTESTLWRLSLADIEATGPFSSLPGMDRYLLSAAPVRLRLSIDGTEHELRHTQVVSFAGDARVSTVAVEGCAQALNLMVRTGLRGGIEVLRGDADLPVTVATAATIAYVVLDGTVTLDGRPLRRLDAVLPGAEESALVLRDAVVARIQVEVP
ncbi:HutD/Ves family protein [Streptomyces boluensis]|uniref:HutD family protein n=1 Tax=Streptomyces boluensis TaxID=1775135 RepID=A0A964UTE8_9ACTN|nr:HutD family protein [Streptomyces boluensis]NBE54080.1 hypothetical protein [Streptomyces boluensis]